jgi:hypothetical protein
MYLDTQVQYWLAKTQVYMTPQYRAGLQPQVYINIPVQYCLATTSIPKYSGTGLPSNYRYTRILLHRAGLQFQVYLDTPAQGWPAKTSIPGYYCRRLHCNLMDTWILLYKASWSAVTGRLAIPEYSRTRLACNRRYTLDTLAQC